MFLFYFRHQVDKMVSLLNLSQNKKNLNKSQILSPTCSRKITFSMESVFFLMLNRLTYLLQIKELKKQQKLAQIHLEEQIFLQIKGQAFLITQALLKTLLHRYFPRIKEQVTMKMDLVIALSLNKLKTLKLTHKKAKFLIHMRTAVQFC